MQLITYEGSEPLPFGSVAHGANTLFYSKEKSDYYLPPITRRGSKLDLRAKVTFYVYAKADRDFIMMISARFNLHSNQMVDFSSGNSSKDFLEILALRPYARLSPTDDITLIEWIFEIEEGLNKFYTAFIRLKDRSRSWLNHEFLENRNKPEGLEFINRTFEGIEYHMFFVGPLGELNSKIFWRWRAAKAVTINYIHQPSALTLTKVVGSNEKENHNGTAREPFVMRSYDQFGNVGAFMFTHENPKKPKLFSVYPHLG